MDKYRQYGQHDEKETHEGDNLFLAVNLRLGPDNLPTAVLADSENCRMHSGEVEPRLGVIKPGWLNVTSALVDAGIRPVTRFYGSGVFKDPASLEWVILAADGFIYRCHENNARHAFGLPTGVNIYSDVTFCQAFNQLYCFRGRYLAPLVLPNIDSDWQDIVPRWNNASTYNAPVTVLERVPDEVAYGPFLSVTSLTSVADKATVVMGVAHGYVTGADITITGANEASYNGRYNITVVDEAAFTYQFAGNASATATGTIKCSNQSLYWAALGSQVTLTALTRSGTTATGTKVAHGFTGGQYVTIAGASPAAYNGTYLMTVPTADTFTYVMLSDPGPSTVMPTATTSIVLAGQSPDTNPEAWARVYNILPNADNAIFINNRMLVPTAYSPGAAGADGYNSAATSYTKKDFIVATSIQDDVHFDFVDEFRINQGSDDEIVDLLKYDNNTVIVFKEKSWGIISNIRIDLSQVSLDMRGVQYGLCARGAAVVAGKDVYFMATSRGVVSLNQTEQGLTQSVDTPFSNDIEPWIRRINWSVKQLIRMTCWDNKLYVGVPMDDCTVSFKLVGGGLQWDVVFGHYIRRTLTVVPGNQYYFTIAADTTSLTNGADTLTASGYFIANLNVVTLNRSGGLFQPSAVINSQVSLIFKPCCNAILVHDFRNLQQMRTLAAYNQRELGHASQAWAGRDIGDAICPKEFVLTHVAGRERMLFTAIDGFVNIYEEAWSGDDIRFDFASNGIGTTPIAMKVVTRGFTQQEIMPKKFPFAEIGMSVWNAKLSLSANVGQGRSSQALIANKEFSRTAYLRPFDATPWDATNVANDFSNPNRGNYSVLADNVTGIQPGASLKLCNYYDVWARWSTRTLAGGYVQFTLTNSQGRCTLKAIAPAAQTGPRRMGVIV